MGDFKQARGLLDRVLATTTLPWLRVMAHSEGAKLAWTQELATVSGREKSNDTIFGEEIGAGKEETTRISADTVRSRRYSTSFLVEYSQVHLLDTELRGLGLFGSTAEERGAVATEVRRFSYGHGLTQQIDRGTLPYSLAAALLRSSCEVERTQGVLLCCETKEHASAEGFYRQIDSGQRLLQVAYNAGKLPTRFEAECCRCEKVTMWLYDATSYACRCIECSG